VTCADEGSGLVGVGGGVRCVIVGPDVSTVPSAVIFTSRGAENGDRLGLSTVAVEGTKYIRNVVDQRPNDMMTCCT